MQLSRAQELITKLQEDNRSLLEELAEINRVEPTRTSPSNQVMAPAKPAIPVCV